MLSTLFSAPVSAAYHLVLFLATLLGPIFGSASAAAAIVLSTVVVRAALLPLSAAQFRGERARTRLLPAVQEIRRTHGSNPERLQRELTALYRAEGASPLTGCLPLLIQLPIFSVLYRLFVSSTVAGQPNLLLARRLAGAPLGGRWFTELLSAGPFGPPTLVFLALFGLLAAVGLWSAYTVPRPETPTTVSRLARLLPFATVLVAAVMPLADGLYLLAGTAWTVAERAIRCHRREPAPAPAKATG